MIFGSVLHAVASKRFHVVFQREGDTLLGSVYDDLFTLLCLRNSGGFVRLLSPVLGSHEIAMSGLFETRSPVDKFGSGRFQDESSGYEFLLIGRKFSARDDLPSNVFVSLCAVTENGTVLETADLQVNISGEIVPVNCFKAHLPSPVRFDEKSVLLVSGEGSWNLNRLDEHLHMRVPSSMAKYMESYSRRGISLQATHQGGDVIFSKSEYRMYLLNAQMAKKTGR